MWHLDPRQMQRGRSTSPRIWWDRKHKHHPIYDTCPNQWNPQMSNSDNGMCCCWLSTTKRFIYMHFEKGMYGLPQTSILEWLALFRYFELLRAWSLEDKMICIQTYCQWFWHQMLWREKCNISSYRTQAILWHWRGLDVLTLLWN